MGDLLSRSVRRHFWGDRAKADLQGEGSGANAELGASRRHRPVCTARGRILSRRRRARSHLFWVFRHFVGSSVRGLESETVGMEVTEQVDQEGPRQLCSKERSPAGRQARALGETREGKCICALKATHTIKGQQNRKSISPIYDRMGAALCKQLLKSIS